MFGVSFTEETVVSEITALFQCARFLAHGRSWTLGRGRLGDHGLPSRAPGPGLSGGRVGRRPTSEPGQGVGPGE